MAVLKLSKSDIHRNNDDDKKLKLGKSQISYDSAMVSGWETKNKNALATLNQYGEKINGGGFMSADDLKSYRNAMDEYISTSTKIRRISGVFGGAHGEEDEREWSSAVNSLETGYDKLQKIFSKYKSEEDYFRTSPATRAERQQQYANNQTKIEELRAEMKSADTSFTRKLEINAEIAALQAENNQYYRGEDGWTSKKLDDYYGHIEASDFESGSANRNIINPSREDLDYYDAMLDNAQWYYDAKGVRRDAFGNEIDMTNVDENGHIVHPMANDEKFAVKDRLGMYLNATDDEKSEAVGMLDTEEGSWAKVLADGEYYHWDNLTSREIDIYYYLLNTQGTSAADKFLDDMEVELSKRETMGNIQKWEEDYENADILGKIFLNAASVPANVFGGAIGYIDDVGRSLTGQDYNPYNIAHSGMHYTNTVRGLTAEDLDETGFKIPLIDFSLGDIYQTGMSRLDSALATGIGGGAGTFLLGMGAAQNEGYRLYQQGASAEQITWGALTAGAAEVVWEYASFEKLVNLKDAKTIGQWVKNALIQSGMEAGEEFLTELSNTITNAIIMGNQSDLAKLYEKNSEDGFKTFLGLVQQHAQAAFGGFLGGVGAGVTQGGKTYINTQKSFINTGNAIRSADGGADALKNLANEVAGVQAGNVTGEVASGKGIGKLIAGVKNLNRDQKVGKLYDAVRTSLDTQSHADIVKSLTRGENGLSTKEANAIAGALLARENGMELTDKQSELLESVKDDPKVQRVLDEVINNEKSTVGQRHQQMRDLDKDIAIGMLTNQFAKSSAEKEFTPEGVYDVSDKGKAIRTDTNEEIDIKSVSAISEGNLVLEISDGSTISAKNVSFGNKSDALIYEAVARLGDNIDAEGANELISQYKGGNAELFARGITQAYTYGFYGIDKSEMFSKYSLADNLTEAQRSLAYNLGKKYRPTKDLADKAKAHLKKAPAEKGVYYRDKDGKATDIETYLKESGANLKDVQKTAIEVMQKMSEMMGVRFNVYETWVENGKHYYLDENGEVVEGNPNGFYDTATGEIYIDLNAGNDYEGTMLFTVAHELTHFMRQWSPEHFTKIAKIVFQHGGMKGSVSKLVALKQAKAKAKGKRLSYDTAMEEVVADAMETILKDGKVVEFMADVKQKDHAAWEKIKEWFKNLAKFLQKMVDAYKGQSAQTIEGAKVAEFSEDLLNQIKQIWGEGAVAAGENYQTAEVKENTTKDGGVKQQIRGDIVDVTGKEYDSVVELEYKVFNRVKRSGGAYIDFIRNNLIKKKITVLDGNGGLEVIEFAGPKERVWKDGANNDHAVIGELLSAKNDIKKLVILNAVETASISRVSGSNTKHSHQWLDENGWQERTSYVMTEKGIIYPVILKIARARDGRNILYDVHVNIEEGIAADKTATSLRAKKQAGQAVGTTMPSNGATIHQHKPKVKHESAEPATLKSERNTFAKTAVAHFGRTYSWKETGYLLTDGARLDFSGRHEGAAGGYRTVDHRDILDIYPEDTDLDGNGAMVDFMRQGNIRIMPEGDGINLQVQPTKAQEQALDDFISRARGEVTLDIDDANGNTVVSVEYPRGTRASKVLQDIRNYFENGTEPVVSDVSRFRYSDRDTAYLDAVERGDIATAQKMVEQAAKAAGFTVKAYHGTDADAFNVFDKGKFGSATGVGILGDGFYFADSKKTAQKYGKNVYTVYLRQLNPYAATDSDAYQLRSLSIERQGYDSVVLPIGPTGKGKVYMVLDPNQIKSAEPVTYDDKGNVIPLSERFKKESDDIRYSDRDYSYNGLTSKPDMAVTLLDGNVPTNRADVIAEAKKNAAKVGKFDPKTGSVSVHVNDIDADVLLTTAGLRHGLDRRFNVNAPVTVMIGEILKNSIRINEMNPTKETASESYALIGAARTADGQLYVVRSVVNRFSNEVASVEVLYAVNAKTEADGIKKGNQAGDNPQGSRSQNRFLTDSTISIAELLDHVNKYFPDILPEDVLKHFGHDRRPDGKIGESALYQDRTDDSISNRTLLANALEGVAQNDMERNRIAEYKEKIGQLDAQEKKLRELNAQIKELSFAKGPRDTKKIRELRDEAIMTTNRIGIYDKQLLRLEASAPLQKVLEREKSKAYKRAEKKGKEALEEYKAKAEAQQKETAEKWRESRKKAVEGRKKTAVREKVKNFKAKLERTLLQPTDRQYVPIDLIKAMVEVCEVIDTDTDLYKADGSINKAQQKRDETKEKLQNLKDEYEKLKTNSDPIYQGEFDEMVYTYLTELRDKFSGKSLKDMSLDDLTEMYEILVSIDETLSDARKLIGWGDAEDVYEAGDAIISEQRKIAESRKNGKRNFFGKANDSALNLSLSPVRNVERMSGYNGGSYLLKLFKKFEQGIRKKNFFVMNAYKSFEHLTSGKEYEDAIYKAVGKEYTDIKGRKFYVSKMQMMQAILSYERERANSKLHHIEKGGFTFANLDMLSKGKLNEAVSAEHSHRVPSATDMVAEFQDILKEDKWCQNYMAVAREFFDKTAKDAINETSIVLKHRIIAKDKSYIPFEVDTNFVNLEITDMNAVQKTINGYGMLSDTQNHAPQPLYITGLNNILDRHIEQVGNVYGLAIEVRNFNKVWNAKTADGLNKVNEMIETNWGKGGVKHIEQVVKDIQGPRVREKNLFTDVYDKVKSGYIGSTFLLNLSVVTKQIGSLYSAISMLRWRDPFSQMGNLIYTMANHKKISAEVDKYTATAWLRRQGVSDAELHTLMTEGKKSWWGRLWAKAPAIVNPTKWITAMDHAVALSLWRYAKIDTAKKTGLKGEELLKATAEFYDEVVENTQSMTDVLHRPEIQKQKNILAESFAMFKTDLYQMAGQLHVTAGRFGANKTKENGMALGRTVYSIAMGAIWGQFMTTLFALLRYKVKPYRDEEDEELTAESWLKRQGFAFVGDIMGYILPILGSEVVGFFENIKYGESEDIADSLALTLINDLYDSMITIGTSINDREMPELADMRKLTAKALQIFGVPANNILRTWDAIELHAKDIANGEFFSFEAGTDRSAKHHIHRIVEAADGGKTDVAIGLFEEALDELATKKAKGGEYGEDEMKDAKSDLKSALGQKYKDGEVTKVLVTRVLEELFEMDEDDIYWTFDRWDYAKENGSSDDYAKYSDFYTAVETGKNLNAIIKKYTDNGVSEETLRGRITSYFKPKYIEMTKAERADIEGYLINAYALLGYDRTKAAKDIRKWLEE